MSETVMSLLHSIDARLCRLEAARSESEDTQRSEASQPVLPADLVEAVREFVRKVKAGEARSKRSYAAFKAALASLPDPLPTVESVRADERERLAPHLHTAIAVITEMLEREGISDPETFPPLVEIRAAWLRSQKDTTHDQ